MMIFNRGEVEFGGKIEQPSDELIKNTLSLHNASLEDAIKYGGDLTRAAIGAMDLTFSKKYIVVDTKVHMLIPGMCPAIVGWHTDGVPRGSDLNPQTKGKPNIQAQEEMDSPIFHLLVTGDDCRTKFIDDGKISLNVPKKPDTNLYKMVSQQVNELEAAGEVDTYSVPSCTAVKWDWWELHTGVPATKHGWRFLIRVTESDIQKPKTDLRDIIRLQQQAYLPETYGW